MAHELAPGPGRAVRLGRLRAFTIALAVTLERARTWWRELWPDLRAARALCAEAARSARPWRHARSLARETNSPAFRAIVDAVRQRRPPVRPAPSLAEALEAAVARRFVLRPEAGLALLGFCASVCTTFGLVGTLSGFQAEIPSLLLGGRPGTGLAEAVGSSMVGALFFLTGWAAHTVLRGCAAEHRAALAAGVLDLERAFARRPRRPTAERPDGAGAEASATP